MYVISRSTAKAYDVLNEVHMYWIEIITKGLPPCLVIYGNTSIQTITASA